MFRFTGGAADSEHPCPIYGFFEKARPSEIDGHFDGLFFSECVLGRARVQGQTLSVPISGLFVLGSHPPAEERAGPYEGELVFEGAGESRRKLIEYIGAPSKPDGFRLPREEVDALASVGTDDGIRGFDLEGYQAALSAWNDDCRVRAKSFKLRALTLPSSRVRAGSYRP